MSAAAGPAVSKVGAALRDHGSRIDSHGSYWMVQCPAHEDRKASLSLAQGDAGAVLYCQAGCETSAILDVLKLGWADLFDEPRKAREQAPRRVVAEYKYTDDDGELLFVKVRYEPKDFRVKRPDGRGGWTYKLGDTRRVLYRLPDVLAAIRDRKTVFLVEGEKDADRLAGLGYTATCNFDGAAKAGYRPKWRPEYGDMLRDADVVIVRDRDEAGEGHARAAYADLKAKAASVRVVQAAVTSKGADLSDHLNAGHSVSDLEPAEDSIDAGSAQADTHLPGIPEYPVDALTGPLREIVDAGLAAGLPAALVGGAALGALATACGQADLAIYETWTVRPCLWVAMIAPPGGGKTPAITLARRMLRDLDAKMHASYTDDLQMWLATPAKDRGEPPADPTRLINDITIEMVARWLAAGDGTGGVDADELTEWLRSLSKYRQGGGTDAARWLGLWSTQPWRYQRVGAHIDLLVRRPVITVCGGIQPQFLPLLGREGDGMRPRWLPHMSLTTDLDPRASRRRQHGTPPSRSSTKTGTAGRGRYPSAPLTFGGRRRGDGSPRSGDLSLPPSRPPWPRPMSRRRGSRSLLPNRWIPQRVARCPRRPSPRPSRLSTTPSPCGARCRAARSSRCRGGTPSSVTRSTNSPSGSSGTAAAPAPGTSCWPTWPASAPQPSSPRCSASTKRPIRVRYGRRPRRSARGSVAPSGPSSRPRGEMMESHRRHRLMYLGKLLTATILLMCIQQERLATSQVRALAIDLGKLLTAATVFLPTVMWRQFLRRHAPARLLNANDGSVVAQPPEQAWRQSTGTGWRASL